MQLRKLTGLDRQEIEDELRYLHELIKQLEAILADENEILRLIKEELLEMKEKYGDERRTKIIDHELGKFSDEELIPEEETVVILTAENYIKRTLVSEYRRQNRGGKGKRGMSTKEEDGIDQLIPATPTTGCSSLPTRVESSASRRTKCLLPALQPKALRRSTCSSSSLKRKLHQSSTTLRMRVMMATSLWQQPKVL